MNKVILVAGGTAVVSLAAGAASGYFFAKNKLGKEFDERLTKELNAAEKHYAVRLMEVKSGKPDSPLDVPISDDEDLPEEEFEPANRPVEDIRTKEQAQEALTDYQGVSSKKNGTVPAEVVRSNVFDKKPTLPPRGEKGRFVPAKPVVEEERVPGPYLISPDDYLHNDPEHHQDEMLRWYIEEETLLTHGDEEVDLDKVGLENLALENFPDGDEHGGGRYLFVRNEGMKEDFQIQLMETSLVEDSGFDDEYRLNSA